MSNTFGPIKYLPSFLTEGDANHILSALIGENWNGIDWERRSDAPRYEYWTNDFNQPYSYGKGAGLRTYESRPLFQAVDKIRQYLLESGLGYFEGCFLNGYADSSDSLGWHADDDPFIDHERPIAIVSLGEARLFEYKPKDAPNSQRQGISTKHGSLILMKPGMQFTHLHRIPKAGFIAKPRISLTYRALIVQK